MTDNKDSFFSGKTPYLAAALALALIIVWSVGLKQGWYEGEPTQPVIKVPTGMAIGGDFALESADGPVSLKNMRNKAVLVIFGYTSCPDVCPTTLSTVASAFSDLEAQGIDRMQGVLISIDPERDTVDKLKEYTSRFHPKIIGATGTPQAIKEVVDRYKAFFAKAHTDNSDAGHTFSHTTSIYVVGPDGKLKELLTNHATPKEMAEAIRRVLK